MTDTAAPLAQELHARLTALLESDDESGKQAVTFLLRKMTNGIPVKENPKKTD